MGIIDEVGLEVMRLAIGPSPVPIFRARNSLNYDLSAHT